jgi:hypothetical protein
MDGKPAGHGAQLDSFATYFPGSHASFVTGSQAPQTAAFSSVRIHVHAACIADKPGSILASVLSWTELSRSLISLSPPGNLKLSRAVEVRLSLSLNLTQLNPDF